MQILFSLFDGAEPGLIFPNRLLGWIGLFAMVALLAFLLRRTWEGMSTLRERLGSALVLLVGLVVAALIAPGFFGVRLPGEVLPVPGMPMENTTPALMFFAAVPMVLAGGLLGPLPALIVGLVTGLMTGLLQTHSPFTILEFGFAAVLFSTIVRQNYRTWFFRLLRHPLAAAVLVIVIIVPILILSTLFATNDVLAVRLDYAFTQVWLPLAARGGELLIAGLIAELVMLAWPAIWQNRRPYVPSPPESSIEARFYYGIIPLVMLLVLTLIVGDWLVAGRAARQMLRDRLQSTAEVAAESLPYFLETGQNLIRTMAISSADVLALPVGEQQPALERQMLSVPYFRQLFLFDEGGAPVTGYPLDTLERMPLTQEEEQGVQLALKGISPQYYVVQQQLDDTSVQISFIGVIRNAENEALGVLLGRTDLNTNPFMQPVIKALEGLQTDGGEGFILNEKGIILYHPSRTEVLRMYPGTRPDAAAFREETSPNNARQYVYYQPVEGRPWAIVLTVPARLAQQAALEIAIPLLFMLLVFTVLAFLFMHLTLRAVTASLQSLVQEATFISMGQLDHALQVKGVDEVGRLSLAFEQMRKSLKARLEELNSLLSVSQGVAANLDISEAVMPILQAALLSEASAARLVLVPDVTLDAHDQAPVAFGTGTAAPLYAYLDGQLFDLMRGQELLSLPNVSRTRRLALPPSGPQPAALIALAVHNENRFYGVLWVAFDKPRSFTDEEIRFLSTLSGEASLAATSARLYATAEVGRQRLEAVLTSTPEPVLVIDEQARLLLLNPAAMQVSGLVNAPAPGKQIQEIITQADLLTLLTMPLSDRISSREVLLGGGKIFYASVSPVVAEGRQVGRVCILRDITHFKELEQLKSEFVSTVSHDLRSPLTLMRGYATMLQMVGELNEQQKGYVRKIVTGIENMSRLVNNLLDLGRIETGIGLKTERISLPGVTEDVINSLQLQAAQKDIRLVQDVVNSETGLAIEADPALIQQAMVNLVENAIKYTGVGGQVKIRLVGQQNSVLVEVHDTGIGIAPLDLPHLFEKFYRSGRREAYSQKGTGLGLAIVKSIVERHGGRVWVDSTLGKGSVFSMELPCEQNEKTLVGIA